MAPGSKPALCRAFFKQKTAYAMILGDWSSDVCSSDLISGVIIAIVAIFSIVLASCSKDEILSDTHPEVNITAQQGDTPAVSYYAITDSTGIGFTSQGIEYTNQNNHTTQWLLSYAEIAERLELHIQDYSQIRITRDHILSNGLWRFAVSFDAQAEVDSYAIDVDPDTGKIIWTLSTTEMPGGEFTLSISVGVSK